MGKIKETTPENLCLPAKTKVLVERKREKTLGERKVPRCHVLYNQISRRGRTQLQKKGGGKYGKKKLSKGAVLSYKLGKGEKFREPAGKRRVSGRGDGVGKGKQKRRSENKGLLGRRGERAGSILTITEEQKQRGGKGLKIKNINSGEKRRKEGVERP